VTIATNATYNIFIDENKPKNHPTNRMKFSIVASWMKNDQNS
jgi:hypothetical protein